METTSAAVLEHAGFADFKEFCAKERLRRGTKETINTTTWETQTWFTIDIKLPKRQWLPLRMPDGNWCFGEYAQRELVMEALKAK